MSKFQEYLETLHNAKAKTKEFKSKKEFDLWLKEYLNNGGKLSDKINLVVPNKHGNPIIYHSPGDVINEG